MPLNCYIVDDESAARERLEYLINNFLGSELNILGNSNDPGKSQDDIISLNPDLIFLDVEMPGMTGLELAESLRTKGYKGNIIFVSAYGHYAIKALRFKAFDYLLKPVDVDELKSAINRIKEERSRLFNPTITKNYELSDREIELVSLLAQGLSSEEIAKEMYLSRHTVDTHRRNIHNKTGTRNSVELLNLLKD